MKASTTRQLVGARRDYSRSVRPNLITGRGRHASVTKSVKVHDDTHAALKVMKVKRRSKSIDQVIRELIKASDSGSLEPVGSKSGELTEYMT